MDEAMLRALKLAEIAYSQGEVPVGAVIMRGDEVLAEAYNQRETKTCVTQHAEIVALELACRSLGSWRLENCHMYVTLEPCLMCAGALYQSRIAAVSFGTNDPKAGALGSLYRIHEDLRLNHRFTVYGPLAEQEAGQLLRDFFRERR